MQTATLQDGANNIWLDMREDFPDGERAEMWRKFELTRQGTPGPEAI